MILLSLDFETTGLNVVDDRVIEFGAVLYSTGQKKCLDNQGMLVKADKEVTQAVTNITGITQTAVDRFGYDSENILDIILEMITNADAVIGYNCRRFDKRVLEEWARRAFPDSGREIPERLWIDLYQDLPWQVPVGKLSHVMADHGFLNYFPHSAMSDAQGVILVSTKYDPNLLVARAQSPVVILRSRQNQIDNDLVKQPPFKFRWNPATKIWWKPVKEQDVDEVIKQALFPITVEKERTLEELDN